ncbi:MAG: hypothetical protein Q4E76_02830 [Tissierellia bacterium]|nr:hypothetical protein [Tissierellia bacterium]
MVYLLLSILLLAFTHQTRDAKPLLALPLLAVAALQTYGLFGGIPFVLQFILILAMAASVLAMMVLYYRSLRREKRDFLHRRRRERQEQVQEKGRKKIIVEDMKSHSHKTYWVRPQEEEKEPEPQEDEQKKSKPQEDAPTE